MDWVAGAVGRLHPGRRGGIVSRPHSLGDGGRWRAQGPRRGHLWGARFAAPGNPCISNGPATLTGVIAIRQVILCCIQPFSGHSPGRGWLEARPPCGPGSGRAMPAWLVAPGGRIVQTAYLPCLGCGGVHFGPGGRGGVRTAGPCAWRLRQCILPRDRRAEAAAFPAPTSFVHERQWPRSAATAWDLCLPASFRVGQ
jgi:hypothetical protein